jgi:hypothetical protein
MGSVRFPNVTSRVERCNVQSRAVEARCLTRMGIPRLRSAGRTSPSSAARSDERTLIVYGEAIAVTTNVIVLCVDVAVTV